MNLKIARKMQRTAWGERPQTRSSGTYEQREHTGHFDRKQHAHWRDAGHNVQGTSSTCDYNVYDYHNQHARGYADGKYDVYTKYSGYAPGAAGAWQQPQHHSAYGRYACYNQSQWTKHDASAWMPGLVQEHGQDNVRNEHPASGGQWTRHDASAWLQTLLTEDWKHEAKDDEAALGSLRYTQDVHNGVKRLIDTVGDGGKADEQHRSAKMRKLYDPGNIEALEDYDVDNWGME